MDEPTLLDIVGRTVPPVPWEDGDNIPWDDPAFSERMLGEHLSQEHDLASRRLDVIERQVEWIHESLLGGRPSTILDLCCGPGLYLNRLGTHGHGGTGIDFSPASIAHAAAEARRLGLDVDYRRADVRSVGLDGPVDLVMVLYGQINVFRREEARAIIARAAAVVRPGGTLLLEPQTFEHIRDAGRSAPSWSSHRSGLFSAEPHLLLVESAWDDELRTGTERFHVIDAATGTVRVHGLSNEAYTEDDLVELCTDAGFATVELRPGLGDVTTDGLLAVIARR